MIKTTVSPQNLTDDFYLPVEYRFFHTKDEPDCPHIKFKYHNHDFYEFYCLVSGNVQFLIEGKIYKLRPWDILLINRREIHNTVIQPGEVYERIVFWINPDFAIKNSTPQSDLTWCFNASIHQNYSFLRPDSEVCVILQKIINRFERTLDYSEFGNEILKNLYLIELLVFLNKAMRESTQKIMDIEYNDKVNDVISYINANLTEDLSLDSLADRFFMSKYNLLRKFQKYTGCSVYKYIRQKRLVMAKTLLREGEPVLQVCKICGFGDYSHFIRYFKEETGVSPKQYVKIIQSEAHFVE